MNGAEGGQCLLFSSQLFHMLDVVKALLCLTSSRELYKPLCSYHLGKDHQRVRRKKTESLRKDTEPREPGCVL